MSLPVKSSLLAALCLVAMVPGGFALASTADDTVDVAHLMHAYHEAVVSHDGARLAALFVPAGGAWFNVLSDQGWAHVRARNPKAAKVRAGSAQSFAAYVGATKSNLDPEHGDVKILSDGTIATVYFDFRFLADGKETNRGSESWHLVKGPDGWRIASIIYSSTPPGA